jgi:hypothetical protein|tara:strand:+ start:278 stop:715 length:438 start_codon:yes stop_codon:yes gene_type:complete
MRDFQVSKVYRWEQSVLWGDPHNWKLDTLDECRILVEKIWLREGVRKPYPKVGDGRGRRSAASFGGEIRLPRCGKIDDPYYLRTAVVICHEISHEMLHDRIPRVKHTEDFVSTFITVLHNNLGISKDALIESAMDFKVKMNHDLL